MTHQELEQLADTELMRRMDAADDVDRLLQHEGWKPFEEAMRRVALHSEEALRKVSPGQFSSLDAFAAKVAELQIMVKFYRDILPSIKKEFAQDKEVAFALAAERGLIARAVQWFSNFRK